MAIPKTLAASIKLVRSQISMHGLLLLSDPVLPSIVGLIAGEPVRGSWWGHASGNLIFNTSVNLDEAGDVITTRLINGKVTFVGASLWPALAAVGTERAVWQTAKLSGAAKTLFAALQKSRSGTLQSDQIGTLKLAGKKPGDVMKELELKLLVHATEVHTESGAHAKVVQTWAAFQDGLPKNFATGWRTMSAAAGRAELSAAVKKFAGTHPAKLPWGKL